MKLTEKWYREEFSKLYSEFKKTGLEENYKNWAEFVNKTAPVNRWIKDYIDIGWEIVQGKYKWSN